MGQISLGILRRDPDFISAFNNLLRLSNLYNDGNISEEEVDNATKEFSKEFEIPQPIGLIDYKKSYDELEKEKGKDSLTIYFLHRNVGNAVSMITDFGGNHHVVPKDHLVLDIDFSKVNSITALKELVTWHIDIYWKQCFLPRNCDQANLIKKVDFDKIIQVGDLKRQEKRISWEKVAERFFPGDPNGKRKAKQHYARYEELVNGGWRMFRFP